VRSSPTYPLSPGAQPAPERSDLRWDPLTGAPVLVVRGRQGRPNLTNKITPDNCPFCPGGREAPEPYKVRWFQNRWPPLPAGRAEIVLFSPDHYQSLGSLPQEQMEAVVGLWVERTEALAARRDVSYVLLFENRGAEVGATIPHPHGQIYGFDFVPPVPLRELAAQTCAICDELAGKGPAGPSHSARLLVSAGGWQAWCAWAPAFPFELSVAPEEHAGDLPRSSGHQGLAEVLRAVLGALDRLFDEDMPYMLWCHQKPSDGETWPCAHVHFHVAPIHRAKGVARYVASGEVGTGVMFNPVGPDDAAQRLRKVLALA
jgi:UDPglucose--hexose-1-phosphate uridylyltransferase